MRPLLPLALALIASPAPAALLTFGEALASAETSAPSLQARAQQVTSARLASRAAGALPDPQLRLGIENYPISGPMAGRFGADEMTMTTIGVMQEVPNGARRRAERRLAEAEIGTAEASLEIQRRDVRVAAGLAWVDLYFADQRLRALDEILRTLQPLWEAAPAGVASGSVRPARALAPVRMRAALDDRRSELAAAVGKARAELTRWTGDPQPTPAGPPPGLGLEPASLRASLAAHTTLAAYDPAGRRAEAEVALARAGKRPDWAFELSYGRRDPMFGDMVSAGVSVRLPLFASRRQDPLIAARTVDAARIGAEREAARRELAANLEASLAEHAMHQDQWVRARDVVLPAARRQADLETASYAAGRAGLEDVLEAFTGLAEARLEALDREAAVMRDAVRINLTFGSQAQ